MKLINPKQNFEVNHDEVYSSSKLTNSNQKILLLTLLSNHKKYNTKHYSFTLSEELCEVLKVSNPTFRKERDKLEALNLFVVKVKIGEKMQIAKAKDRKHLNLYYYPNWDRLNELGFIKIKKHFKDVFELGTVINVENMKKLVDETYYNCLYYDLDLENKRKGRGMRIVKNGIEIRRSLNIEHSSFKKHGIPKSSELTYQGLFKEGQDLL